MFFIIASLLDGGKLSVWITTFRSGMFMAGVPVRFGKDMEGIGLLAWHVGAL